jgi:hypothetical protein
MNVEANRNGLWSVPAALRKGRPAPAHATHEVNRADEILRKVNRLQLTGPGSTNIQPVEQTVRVAGDHLYVAELWGTGNVFVRFSRYDSDPVQLVEGATYLRRFDSLLFRFERPGLQDSADIPAFVPALQLVAYATFGPFTQGHVPRSYGVKPGFLARSECTADTTPRIAWALLLDEYSAFSTDPLEHFGLNGGSLILHNQDLTNDLLYKYQRSTDPGYSASFPHWAVLEPGRMITLPLEGRIGYGSAGVVVATRAGTCAYGFIVTAGPTTVSPSPGGADSYPP